MSFFVGQQVVCINDRFSSDPYWRGVVRCFPKLNGVYTIREICEGYGAQQGLIGLCFCELVNPTAFFAGGYAEPAFLSTKFRPVRKTSIEQFQKLLAPRDAHDARTKERRREPSMPA